MKAASLLLFSLAVVAQWVVPLTGIWQHEQVLARGTLVRIKCTAPDPYDPLRGRYLAVRPAQSEAPCDPEMDNRRGARAYAILEADAQGLAKVARLVPEPPASGDYVRVRQGWAYEGKARFDWPFDRFYLNEELAPEADKWLAESLRDADGVIAEVRVLDGRAVLADLTLDGKSFREHLKARLKQPAP